MKISYAKGYILKNLSNDVKVVSVVGFPLGANLLKTKLCEVKQAVKDAYGDDVLLDDNYPDGIIIAKITTDFA